MIWMEIRCDKQHKGSSCYSYSNRGPMRLAPSNSAADVALTRNSLLAEAKRKGWTIDRRHGVICPSCAAS